MSLPDSSAFHHGKEARKNGLPCIISDGRIKPETRADWYAGWNHQDAMMMPPPSAEEIAQNQQFFSALAAEVRASTH